MHDAQKFWNGIREHSAPFFDGADPLWRLSLPSTASALGLPGRQLIEWNGGLRWIKTSAEARVVREAAAIAGGSATLFRAAGQAAGVFPPLDPVKLRLHRELKAIFDPAGILNPGRLYPEL